METSTTLLLGVYAGRNLYLRDYLDAILLYVERIMKSLRDACTGTVDRPRFWESSKWPRTMHLL